MREDSSAISVAIADDQSMVRAGIAMILRAEPDIEVVGEAKDGFEAVELARRHAPDVVLMDLQMPGLDGVQATRLVTDADARDRPTRVVVLTSFQDDANLYAALQAGASGFLLKSADPDELVIAIRRVASGDAWIDPGVARQVIAVVAAAAPSPGVAAPPAEKVPEFTHRLTPRELEILLLMAEGLSNREICEKLSLSEGTVKTHVSRVLEKTGARDRARAVVLAYRAGLVTP
jgi:DNA-binding NarL/FixJ family response regulator